MGNVHILVDEHATDVDESAAQNVDEYTHSLTALVCVAFFGSFVFDLPFFLEHCRLFLLYFRTGVKKSSRTIPASVCAHLAKQVR